MLPDSAETKARTGARILLVDDEDVVRRVTASALRRFGYVVVDAPSGEDGIRLALEQAGALDLLLTDMVMAGASGFDVAAAFRAHNPGRPVIFTSGFSDNATLSRIAREGASFLVKPYDLDGLASAVRNAMGPAQEQQPDDLEGEA